MQIIVKTSRVQDRMLKQRHEAKRKREHMAWHRAQAELFRNMAEEGERQLELHREHMEPEQVDLMTNEIMTLKASAIEMDNATCLEEH